MSHSPLLTFALSPWYSAQPNICELPVLICLKDLCQPGGTVFDIGANVGGLTMVLSRLVGPRGYVCAFEASPNTVSKLQSNVINQGCFNVTVFNRAIYSHSNEILNFYVNDGGSQADSLYTQLSQSVPIKVKTLALDDLCNEMQMYPEVIKIDIEGAEYCALIGGEVPSASYTRNFCGCTTVRTMFGFLD